MGSVSEHASTETVVVRPATPADAPFLWEMLWEAAAVAPEMRAVGKEEALAAPEIRRYLTGCDRPGDRGLVATIPGGERVGAAWVRLFPPDVPGYGFVAADAPELAIGVRADHGRRAAGRTLLAALLADQRAARRPAISLAVDLRNPAVALYRRHGFRTVAKDTVRVGLVMLAELLPPG